MNNFFVNSCSDPRILFSGVPRRPSLERQSTLCDDQQYQPKEAVMEEKEEYIQNELPPDSENRYHYHPDYHEPQYQYYYHPHQPQTSAAVAQRYGRFMVEVLPCVALVCAFFPVFKLLQTLFGTCFRIERTAIWSIDFFSVI